ncbi:MAG TPA: cobyric acid synthase [Bryobacteraceae bacterium]|nr:cobyric acid synthase [Bryobacteraceae bacterium]
MPVPTHQRAKSIFIGGTASHAGKSWMTTAICRYLHCRGLRVAPFKAQNMSNNSYPCAGGGEIGRAQATQAEACGIEAIADMNPILLKPTSHQGCQVVVNGKVWRNLSAGDYQDHFDKLLEIVLEAYERLSQNYEYIVVEGAGSVTEMNLKSRDLVNFGLAERIGAPAMLVSDIDRGGVFAAIAGTFCLLNDAERRLVRSFAINRFRGNVSLFQDGVQFLQDRTSRPCLGVFPMLEDTRIDDEDSVSLDNAGATGSQVAAIQFPRISNFTDLRLLPEIDWVRRPNRTLYRHIILPGSKNTIGDLQWMRDTGLDEWLLTQHRAGAQIIGICGGYQMLGMTIEDPANLEGTAGSAEGLGLLPVTTVLAAEKTTRVVDALLPSGTRFAAYEIHLGITSRPAGAAPFAITPEGDEGIRHNRCIGTYLHGALESPAVVEDLLGIRVTAQPKTAVYDRLADWFAANADIPLFEELYL